jgi:hypothetical protein
MCEKTHDFVSLQKSSMNTQLWIYLAIPMPVAIHEGPFRQSLYDMLDDLCALSGQIPFLYDDNVTLCRSIQLVESKMEISHVWVNGIVLRR